MPYLLYNALLYTALLLGLPVWAAAVALRPKWRAGVWERVGAVPRRLKLERSEAPVVWLHAVSVGEVLAAVPLVRQLEREYRVYVSTTTRTGQTLARSRFGEERVFYFPLDVGLAIERFLRAVQPELVVLLETEFWPNFLRLAHGRAKVLVANARISDRSLPGYQRWRRFMARVLDQVDVFLAQSEEDARRLVAIGAACERVHCAGNLKFDWAPPAEPAVVKKLRRARAEGALGPVVVAGSTVAGEEDLVLHAFARVQAQYPRGLCVLAPRHPERFGEAAEAVARAGLRSTRRSEWRADELEPGVLLLDSIGELASVYQLADVAVVGGSFVARGGHNVLEPAYFGKSIVVGPHTENFREIVRTFEEAEAIVVTDAERLGDTLLQLLADEGGRTELGRRAREVMANHSGATERTMQEIRALLAASSSGVRVC